MKELIIIGGGPAGLSAAIYAQRYRLDALLIAEEIGGTANKAHLVENYPGFPSITGIELMEKFKTHAEGLGAQLVFATVKRIEKDGNIFKVSTESSVFESQNILITTGTTRKKLNVKGEDEFIGRGVSYCATCDAPFYRNKTVAVIGGNDAAAQAALVLAKHASRVFIIYRKYEIRCEPLWYDKIKAEPKIQIISNTEIDEIKGTKRVESVKLNSGKDMAIDGIFIEIGSVPSKALVDDMGMNFDEKGYIIVNEKMQTNVNGLYAAGDITTGSDKFWQIVTAVSEGALATHTIFDSIKKKS